MVNKFAVGLILLLVSGLLVVPAASQDGQHTGRGVVVMGNPHSATGIGSLNPLLCDNDSCSQLVDWLFPTLFATDPKTGAVVNASADNYGMVTQPQLQSGDVQTFTLRDDLKWSDGEPITAYDVFYSYLIISTPGIQSPHQVRLLTSFSGARVMDAHTIAFAYTAPDCASFVRSNFPVAPSHVFDPDFAGFVDRLNAQAEGVQPIKTWWDAYPDAQYRALLNSEFNVDPTATAGQFQFNALRPGEDIRLSADAGKQALVYTDLPDGMNPVEFFLAGGTSVLVNPPYERRDDLRAKSASLRIAEYPGRTWDFISFNLADPFKPKSAFDNDGKPLDQGHHPVLGDVRVRQAIQMAIDVPALIEAAFQGNGVPLAGNQPPASWAFDPSLKPTKYDPAAAERLLESAGWKDTDGDGLRECHGCLYAEENTPLSFSLMVVDLDERGTVAQLIARQLSGVGISVNPQSVGSDSLLQTLSTQQYDAYLGVGTYSEFSDPDRSADFARAADMLYAGSNFGSYANDQLDTLMQQARTVPGCDLAKRTALYGQIQSILHDDLPEIPLYSTTDMVIAQTDVQGFQPIANNPFWNIRDWVVVHQQ